MVLGSCWGTSMLAVWGVVVLLVLTFGVSGAGVLAGLSAGSSECRVLAVWGAEVLAVRGASGAAHGPTRRSRSHANEGLAQGKQRPR